jgi:hypothetical protein
MVMFSIDEKKFVNLDNVFKMELINMEDSNEYYWRFFATDDTFCSSQPFENESEAKEWLKLRFLKAKGSGDIIGL